MRLFCAGIFLLIINNMIADTNYAYINSNIILFSGYMVAENDYPVKITTENNCPKLFCRKGDFSE